MMRNAVIMATVTLTAALLAFLTCSSPAGAVTRENGAYYECDGMEAATGAAYCGYRRDSRYDPTYVANEIIVKYKKDVAEKLAAGLTKGRKAHEVRLSESLDRLHGAYRVMMIKQVFPGFRDRRRKLEALLGKDEALLGRTEQRLLRRLRRARREAKVPDLDRIYKLEIELGQGQSLEEVVAVYRNDPDVEYAQLNYIVSIDKTPDDIRYPLQWPLNNTGQLYPIDGEGNSAAGSVDCDIDAPEAWDIGPDGSEIVVAVVDTGVDYAHRDLDDNMWVNSGEVHDNGHDDEGNGYVDDLVGYDFINDDGDPADDYGHGTHCAGIIAADTNDGLAIAGICWNAQIMALKFLGSDGYGNTEDAAEAIYYAVDNGADVISNSWGGGGYSELLEEAINYAYSQGVIVVASAGNDDTDIPQYPAYYDHVISVAATDSNDEKASFSNYGDWVDIAAPGVHILSLLAGNTSMGNPYDRHTTIASGTSMACPHVAGACALLLSYNPALTTDEVRAILMQTVDPISPGICLSDGRLNVYQAMMGPGNYLIADTGPDQFFKEIQLVTLDGSSSYFPDQNGVKEFRWTQTAGIPVQLSDPCAAVTTFMPEFKDEYSFELLISDGSNTSHPDEVFIAAGNRPPVADAGPDVARSVGQRVNLDGSASCDPDPGDELTYSWRQLEGPVVVLVDANTCAPYFDGAEEGVYVFELVVSDGIDESEPSTVQVTVSQEFRVNTYTDDNQDSPAVATDPNGNFVVAWRSWGQDAGSRGIYGQRFDCDGTPVGGEFQINTGSVAGCISCGPCVAVDGSGNFVVAWTCYDDSSEGIAARRYNAEGVPVTEEFLVNTWTDSRQMQPQVAMNDSGAFVVVWESWRAWGPGMFDGDWCTTGRVYDAAGVPQGDDILITQLPHGYYPDVAMENSGDFVVAWLRSGDSDDPPLGYYVRLRRYNADGTPKEDAVSMTDDLGVLWAGPSIGMDGAGNFVVAYQGGDYGEGKIDVYVQGFDANGNRTSGPCMVNSYEDGWQWGASVAMTDNGEHAIVWSSRYQDGSGYGAYGQLYDSDGAPLGEEFQLNIYVEGDQFYPDVAIGPGGRFVVVWQSEGQDGSGYGIFGRFGQFPIPPIEVAMKLTPQALNPESKGNWMKAHFVLPEGFCVEDVDGKSPAVVEPGGFESEYMNVFVNEDGLVEIEAAFNRSDFCSIVTGAEGIEVTVTGRFVSGQYFYGTDRIKITTNSLEYLAGLASYWLEEGCDKPDWCGGLDLDQNSIVNFIDFAVFDGCFIEVVGE